MEKAQQYEKCKCCGKNTLSADSLFDICENCGWQDDAVQNDNPDYIPYLCGFIRYVAGVLPSGDSLNWQRK